MANANDLVRRAWCDQRRPLTTGARRSHRWPVAASQAGTGAGRERQQTISPGRSGSACAPLSQSQNRAGRVHGHCRPFGKGKSTLLNLIGCIDTPTSGRILIGGDDVSSKTPDQLTALRARTIGFIFQTFNLLAVLSAEENVEYPLLQFKELSAADRRRRVQHYLEVVELGGFAHHRPNQLSGGQRQRVAIARALAVHPKVILADEPTANLDHKTGGRILRLMRRINRQTGTTFVFSTHDQRVIDMAIRRVDLEDGEIVRLGVRVNKEWIYAMEREIPLPPDNEEDDA